MSEPWQNPNQNVPPPYGGPVPPDPQTDGYHRQASPQPYANQQYMYPTNPKEREWYKKKRYAIPAALMIFFVAMSFIGAISGSKSSGEAQTLPQPSPSAAALAPTQAATQPPVVSSSPSPSEATKAPVTLTVPVGKEGQNAQLVVEELEELGFENFIYNSDTGKTVLLLSNWTVTSIDGAGQQQLSSKSVVIHVTK